MMFANRISKFLEIEMKKDIYFSWMHECMVYVSITIKITQRHTRSHDQYQRFDVTSMKPWVYPIKMCVLENFVPAQQVLQRFPEFSIFFWILPTHTIAYGGQ